MRANRLLTGYHCVTTKMVLASSTCFQEDICFVAIE